MSTIATSWCLGFQQSVRNNEMRSIVSPALVRFPEHWFQQPAEDTRNYCQPSIGRPSLRCEEQ